MGELEAIESDSATNDKSQRIAKAIDVLARVSGKNAPNGLFAAGSTRASFVDGMLRQAGIYSAYKDVFGLKAADAELLHSLLDAPPETVVEVLFGDAPEGACVERKVGNCVLTVDGMGLHELVSDQEGQQ